MSVLDETDVNCPYCGEIITVLIDTSIGNQSYVEDCQVCCSPIVLEIEVDDCQNCRVSTQQENA